VYSDSIEVLCPKYVKSGIGTKALVYGRLRSLCV